MKRGGKKSKGCDEFNCTRDPVTCSVAFDGFRRMNRVRGLSKTTYWGGGEGSETREWDTLKQKEGNVKNPVHQKTCRRNTR